MKKVLATQPPAKKQSVPMLLSSRSPNPPAMNRTDATACQKGSRTMEGSLIIELSA